MQNVLKIFERRLHDYIQFVTSIRLVIWGIHDFGCIIDFYVYQVDLGSKYGKGLSVARGQKIHAKCFEDFWEEDSEFQRRSGYQCCFQTTLPSTMIL